MDGPKDCHTQWSKSEREKQILHINIPYICGIWENGIDEPLCRAGIEMQG